MIWKDHPDVFEMLGPFAMALQKCVVFGERKREGHMDKIHKGLGSEFG